MTWHGISLITPSHPRVWARRVCCSSATSPSTKVTSRMHPHLDEGSRSCFHRAWQSPSSSAPRRAMEGQHRRRE